MFKLIREMQIKTTMRFPFTPNKLAKLEVWGEGEHLGEVIRKSTGVPVVAQWLMNPNRNHEVAGSIPGLAQWVKDPALL